MTCALPIVTKRDQACVYLFAILLVSGGGLLCSRNSLGQEAAEKTRVGERFVLRSRRVGTSHGRPRGGEESLGEPQSQQLSRRSRGREETLIGGGSRTEVRRCDGIGGAQKRCRAGDFRLFLWLRA